MSRTRYAVSLVLISAMLLLVWTVPVFSAGSEEGSKGGTGQTSGSPQASTAAPRESPFLSAKVSAGNLPPMAQRLPEVPYVLTTAKVGTFGGTLRTVTNAPERDPDVANASIVPILAVPLRTIAPRVYQGDVVEKLEADEQSKTFTFYMRKGMKWSDGKPLTSEDVRFGFEDVLSDPKLTPVFPKLLTAGGERMKLEVVDTYTFRVVFPVAYGGFPSMLAGILSSYYNMPFYPKHYLQQFHPKYTPAEKIEQQLADAGLAKGEWWTLFQRKNPSSWDMVGSRGIGFPTLIAWVTTSSSPSKVIHERNPYYHRVDQAGNQLPYIDVIETNLISSTETAVLKTVAGEVDYLRELGSQTTNVPLYKENEQKGGYKTGLYGGAVAPIIVLNLSSADLNYRKVVGERRFREALNMAINREEIRKNVFLGIAAPTAVVRDTYDPKKAAQLLDEIGFGQKDNDGWRLGPDGKRIVIPFDISPLAGWESQVTEVVVSNWKAIGIFTTMRTVEFGLWRSEGLGNEIRASVHWAESKILWLQNAPYYTGYLPNEFRSWGPAYRQWFDSLGKDGTVPPAEIQEIFNLRNVITTTVSAEERKKALDSILSSIRENTFFMDILLPLHAVITSAKLENVPAASDQVDSMVPAKMVDQFFFKK